jgi:lysophospholipase L1-like esterase
MRWPFSWIWAGLFLGLPALAAGQAPDAKLPKVVLLGDSIRLSYTPYVTKQLAGQAVVVSPKANGGDSARVLEHLEEWAIRERPAVVHFNCGIHDLKKSKTTGQFQVAPHQYEANLRRIVERLRKETSAVVVFALTTPVIDDRAAKGRLKVDYQLLEASAVHYNQIALRVMNELEVPVNDLRAALGGPADWDKLVGGDGIHLTPAGSEKLGGAVAAVVRRHLPGSPADDGRGDVVVYGGTSGGVVAAVQAARMGRSVVLLAPGRHLGGMTSSGLGATDAGKKEAIGGIAREFYQRVARYYANDAAWKYERREQYRSHLHDPTEDAMWYFEPHVAEKIFTDMVREAGVRVVLGERLALNRGVRKEGARIESIGMESGRRFRARVFLDATYEGDLMARAGVSYHVGRESSATYDEPLAGVRARHLRYSAHNFHRPVDPYVVPGQPASGLLPGVLPGGPGAEGAGDRRVQAYCFRLCLTEVPENRVPFPKPDGYDPGRYELLLRQLTAAGLFADNPKPLPVEHPALGRNPYLKIMPNRKTDSNTKGAVSFNLVGGNYDYPDGDYATRAKIVADHETYQKGLLWFLAHDPRVPERYRQAMAGWGLAKDEFADNGHWPHQLYVREARRMVGAYVLTQHDCEGRRAVADPVGLGSYTMDSHITQRYVDATGFVRNEGTLGGRVLKPYPISYRALVPRAAECTNLLVPVCCSASHVGYGSLRMEPVYMILGQSAATAAVLALEQDVTVQDVSYAKLRARLAADGQRLDGPATKSATP